MQYTWWSMLPFVAMLAGIAVLPLLSRPRHLWEQPRVQLGFALVLCLPVAFAVWALDAPSRPGHAVSQYA